MRHERAWTPSKDTHWTNTINTQSQNETALSSPGVDSVTEGLAIYPVPLLGTLLWNCPINQCLGEAVLPLLTVWPPEQLALYFLLTCPQYDEDSAPGRRGKDPGRGSVRFMVGPQRFHAGERGKADLSEQCDFFRPKYSWRDQYKLNFGSV